MDGEPTPDAEAGYGYLHMTKHFHEFYDDAGQASWQQFSSAIGLVLKNPHTAVPQLNGNYKYVGAGGLSPSCGVWCSADAYDYLSFTVIVAPASRSYTVITAWPGKPTIEPSTYFGFTSYSNPCDQPAPNQVEVV
jgi:hypothetical protein